ncbi:response regulator [Paenibacillus sp. J2TS4]|uniref:response regulator n=1 Tax=Paenibacillus sp. J2TS4 TaxID=2807194 RepID=UPI001B164392|nr:response regulator [Paenibacillus sp. J2TS4]GIP31868.1 hypothetical protein J2TS4_10780 [Paenibacillus sp. J2TS4]
MMYRLLIVDDVPIIVDGLTDLLLEQERFDAEIYQAYSGMEAVEILKIHKIDVVLSDIKMPNMEGIALLREIKSQWPGCKVIFLTSYNDFDYVQSALSLGAFDYILKTEEQAKIVRVVSRAIEELEEEFSSKKLVEKAEHHMLMAIPSLQMEFMRSLLYGKRRDHERIEAYFSEIQLPLHGKDRALLLMARIDSWRDISMRPDQELLVYAVQNITEECLGPNVAFFAIVYDQSRIVWFIQPKKTDPSVYSEEDRWQRTFYFVKGTLETVQNACRQLLQLPVSFVLSRQPSEWTAVSEKFDQLLSLWVQDIGLQSEVLLVEGDRPTPPHLSADNVGKAVGFSLQRKMQLLGYHLENGEVESFSTELSAVLQSLKYEDIHDFVKMEIYHSVSSILMSYMNRHGLMHKVINQIPVGKLLNTSEIASWVDLADYFQRLAEQILRCQKNGRDESTHIIVHKIHEYVQAHIASSISLTDLAEHVYLNASYLSRLYKNVEGIGISEYIASVRNEKAKRLLRETPMQIQEIAKAVGYQSGLAFTRFFKKYNKVTPQEYRNGK